ncbi:MAG: hypothetical protein WA192_03635 [Candidatus Acidiferrales bacterium]
MYTPLIDQTLFEDAFKVLGAFGAIATFLWTVYVWRDKSRQELEAAALDAERARSTRRIEATKPFLERQLELYTAATRAAAIIATSRDPEKVRLATENFWQLFSGELALVENPEVASAMQNFGRALATEKDGNEWQSDNQASQNANRNLETEKEALRQLSLNLATACRNSLARSWGTRAWASPDEASQELTLRKERAKT